MDAENSLSEPILDRIIESSFANTESQNMDYSKIKDDLLYVIPYFYLIYRKITETYKVENILFAGRDSRILYLFFKLLAKTRNENSERFMQIPGSREFYNNQHEIQDSVKLLKTFGITKDNILNKQKYIFIDTGFEGSVGLLFREFVNEVLDVNDDLSELIPILLVSSYTNGKNINEIADFGKAPENIQKELNLYIKYKAERNITIYEYVSKFSRVNDFIAIVMQNIPQYHGVYSKISTKGDRTIAVSSGDEAISELLPIYEINPDFINPKSAFYIDTWLTKQILNK